MSEYVYLMMSVLAGALTNALGVFRSRSVEGVVVFKLDHLGDLVTAAPALEAIRASHPSEEITLVVGSWCEELAGSLRSVDRVVVYDSPAFSRAASARPSRPLRDVLGNRRFREAYALRDDAPAILYCLLGGAARRRDRGTVRAAHKVARLGAAVGGGGDVSPLHEIETNLRIAGARAAGGPPIPRISIDDEAAAAVGTLVEEMRGASRRPLTVVHPGAAWEFRRWPAPRYAELIVRLVDEAEAAVVVTGSADERPLAETVACPGPRCRVMAGELTISAMAALLREADCYVGADTGIMHLAVAVGTPVVALFGPQDPRRFGPVGPRDVALGHPAPCAPCSQTTCSRNGVCMTSIDVDEVAAAVRNVLERRGGGEAFA